MKRPDPCKNREKGLVRLLQFLLRGPATLGAEARGGLSLAVDGRERRFEAALVSAALSRGLITREGRTLSAAPEAATLLKRLLAGVDFGFPAQHGTIEEEERLIEGASRRVIVNRDHSALAMLARMKERDGSHWFSPPAIAAGERLAADFHYAGLQPKITACYGPRLSSATRGSRGLQVDLTDSQIDARSRFLKATDAMGPELSGVAVDVCCFSKGLELVERERQWPARSAKLMLRTALLALARHYG